MKHRYWQQVIWVLWTILIIMLPVSTLPLVMKLTGASSVAPAALLPLIPLAVLLIPLLIWNKSRLPVHVKPVLLFFLFALSTIALAFLQPLPAFKQHSAVSAGAAGAATLLIGLLFFIVSVSLPNNRIKIEKTLRLVNWSGLVLVAWSIFQVLVVPRVPIIDSISKIVQPYLSPTRLLEERMQGFASEPSWLAHMLNLVYLAYWLAASYTKTTVHNFRLGKFTFENLLAAFGVVVLVGTLSRGGLLAFVLVAGLIFILLNLKLIRALIEKVSGKYRLAAAISLVTALLLVYLAALGAGLWAWSRIDPRMETVFDFSRGNESTIIDYADNLRFGERIVYWQTGWNIFNDHPLIGVGVGYSGFYFPQYLPDIGWELTETRNLLFRSQGLLNIKNLWARLLAETGLIGFALFVSFLVLFGFTSAEMVKYGSGIRRTLGFMGIFMLVALIAEEFSVDSFALPYLWFTMGLVVAGWRWYTPENGGENG